jgi:hypothetical protein
MKTLALILLLVGSVAAQYVAPAGFNPGTTSANTYTLANHTAWVSCATPCAISLGFTTNTGGLIYIEYAQANSSSADYITGVSGGGTYVIPTNAEISSTNGSMNAAYTLSSSAVSTITITAAINGEVRIWNYSASGTPAFDQCATAPNTASATPSGIGFTLAASQETIQQALFGSGINSINLSYTNFNDTTNHSASANLANATAGTAPTWSLSSSVVTLAMACAFK